MKESWRFRMSGCCKPRKHHPRAPLSTWQWPAKNTTLSR